MDAAGTTRGAGFLVMPGLVVTCAHVISDIGAGPDAVVRVVFAASSEESQLSARVIPEYWRDEAQEDVAFLELLDEGPPDVRPVILGTSREAVGREFTTFGFPTTKPREGLPGLVHVTGRTSEGGHSVLAVRSNEVSLGFSGAPAWEPASGAVVGMVVSIIPAGADPAGKQSETSFLRPVELLRDVCQLLQLPGTCPYRGLEVFEEADKDFYCGREVATAGLVNLLGREDFVVVVGVSGSGKSSLVRAGLAKALSAHEFTGLSDLTRIAFRPGTNPLRELVEALRRSVPITDSGDPSTARPSSTEVESLLAAVSSQVRGLLIVVDQSEQLFTDTEEATAREFTNLLGRIAAPNRKVLITLRADFYGAALLDSDLAPHVRTGQYTLLPMTDEELLSAVIEPAQRLLRAFEPDLPERIVRDISGRPGDLPLLEFALTELWNRDASDVLLSHRGYSALGYRAPDGEVLPGARGAIVRRAEQFWTSLSDPERRSARRLFLNLASSGVDELAGEPRSRRAWQDELGEDEVRLADRLSAPGLRLVVAGHDTSAKRRTYEVAHEALIRAWPRLRAWLRDHEAFVHWYTTDLAPLLRRWLQNDRADDFLLPGAMLGEAKRWLETTRDELVGPPADYIEASVAAWQLGQERAARERARLEDALNTSENLRAEAERERLIALSRQLAAEAQVMYTDPFEVDAGILLAVESLQLRRAVEGDRALREGIDLLPAVTDLQLEYRTTRGGEQEQRKASGAGSLCVSASGRIMAGAADGGVQIWAGPDWDPVMRLTPRGWIGCLAFSSDERLVAAAGSNLWVWRVQDGALVLNRRLRGLAAGWVGFDRGDRRVAVVAVPRMTVTTGSERVAHESSQGDSKADRGALRAWDIRSARRVVEQSFPVEGAAYAASASADWSKVALGNFDEALVHDLTTGERVMSVHHSPIWTFGVDALNVVSVDFSPNGALLATGRTGWDRSEAAVWSIESGERIFVTSGRSDLVRAGRSAFIRVRFCSDRLLLTASAGLVTIWDVRAGTAVVRGLVPRGLAPDLAPTDERPIPDALAGDDAGTTFAGICQRSVRVWRKARGSEVCRLQKAQVTRTADDLTGPNAVAFSRDGALLAFALAGRAQVVTVPSLATVAATDLHSWSSGGHAGFVTITSMAFTPDDSFLLVADRASIQKWDVHNDRQVWKRSISSEVAEAGRSFVRVERRSDEPGITVYRSDDGEVQDELRLALAEDDRVAFSGDATICLVASPGGVLQVWDVARDDMVGEFDADAAVVGMTVGSDGRRAAIATADQRVLLWRREADELTVALRDHNFRGPMRFSPDATHLAGSTGTGFLSVWDLKQQNEVARLPAGAEEFKFCFASGPRWVAISPEDEPVRILEWHAEDLVARALARVRVTRGAEVMQLA